MYTNINVLKGIIYHFNNTVPSGVYVIDGEKYGIRLEDNAGKIPCLAFEIDEFLDTDIELGTMATRYKIVCNITANSKNQRNALKYFVYEELMKNSPEIPYYATYDVSGNPTSDVEGYMYIQKNISLKDIPNFESLRDKFFWNAVVYFSVSVLTI